MKERTDCWLTTDQKKGKQKEEWVGEDELRQDGLERKIEIPIRTYKLNKQTNKLTN